MKQSRTRSLEDLQEVLFLPGELPQLEERLEVAGVVLQGL